MSSLNAGRKGPLLNVHINSSRALFLTGNIPFLIIWAKYAFYSPKICDYYLALSLIPSSLSPVCVVAYAHIPVIYDSNIPMSFREVEHHLEDLRSNVINRQRRVNLNDVEGMTLMLTKSR